jgi:hypothetical protein
MQYRVYREKASCRRCGEEMPCSDPTRPQHFAVAHHSLANADSTVNQSTTAIQGAVHAQLNIAHDAGTGPDVRIVALVPVYTVRTLASLPRLQLPHHTHKVLRPAMRGIVAHDPPSVTLCLPSKKSATCC